ncbi:Uncharacterised protein [uncultured archaeon]|nr:Uncharacterised protein [uncultured archaeon]
MTDAREREGFMTMEDTSDMTLDRFSTEPHPELVEAVEVIKSQLSQAPPPEMEAKPTEEGVAASIEALAEIRSRSFSGRNLHLGKMVKCHVCGQRGRETDHKHEQKFAKRWIVVNGKKVYTEEELIAGRTVETHAVMPTMRNILGASRFKGKRKKPRPTWRQNEMIQLVRSLVPDEFTPEELEAAKKKARRMLAKKYGRHGYLPPKWHALKAERLKKEVKA